MRDVSERLALLEQLRHQAFHDSLTGLPNRALFEDRLRRALVRLRRSGGFAAVMFVDLDDFKTVNDGLGHAAGDELLRATARRLEDTLRTQDTAARLGGDEFAVLLEDLVDEAEALAIAERVRCALEPPLTVAGHQVTPSASIGVACPGPAGRRRRAAAQRRRRHVRGQGARQGPGRAVRGRDAPAGHRAPGADRRARCGDGGRRAGPRLPAADRAEHRRHRRLRGADPLAPPDARAARARPLHRPCRVHRPHRRHRGVGHPERVPAAAPLAGRAPGRRASSRSASTSPPASSRMASCPPWCVARWPTPASRPTS